VVRTGPICQLDINLVKVNVSLWDSLDAPLLYSSPHETLLGCEVVVDV
jgi:hypothetical protein